MTDPGSRLFFLFHRAQHVVFRRANRELQARLGVPLAQISALLALEAGALSQRELGKALGLEGPAISTLVARMENAELIQRDVDAHDARIYRLRPAPRGRALKSGAKAIVDALGTELMTGFSAGELATITRFFETLLARALLGTARPP